VPDCWTGLLAALSPASLARAGQTFVELYRLQQSNPFLDFEAVARERGKAALRAHLAAQPDLVAASEGRLDLLVDYALEILAQVTRSRFH
jgi:hypothetical protein